jgi:ribonuclease HI
MTYTCYTDWSAIHNPWPWWRAWVVVENNSNIKSWSWWVLLSTNNKMELQAVIELLKSFIPFYETVEEIWWEWLFSSSTKQYEEIRLVVKQSLVVITDSTYVQKWVTEWLEVWIRRWWRRSKWWKLIANAEQWKELKRLLWYFEKIEWRWTKAHVGTQWNERVDSEARRQALRFNAMW